MSEEKVCDRYCAKCIYSTGCTDWGYVCNYYLETGKRRPCPPGTGCTVKSTGKKIRYLEQMRDIEWSKRMLEARKAKAVPHKKICKECGLEFEAVYKNRSFCSKRCKDRFHNRAKRKRNKIPQGDK